MCLRPAQVQGELTSTPGQRKPGPVQATCLGSGWALHWAGHLRAGSLVPDPSVREPWRNVMSLGFFTINWG